LEEVGVAQDGLRDGHVVDVAAVRRLQILDGPRFAGAIDARVTARHRIAIDLDVTIRAAPEHDLVARECEAFAHIRAGRIDENETRLASFLGRFDDLDLGNAGLPLAPRRN